MKILDLSGEWHTGGESFFLPGSACGNSIGARQEEYAEMTPESVRCLRPRFGYIGALTLERTIDVPEDFEGKRLTLFLERVNIASELWIDGEKIGRQIIELSTPHRHSLTGRLSAGRHTIALKIDNRNLLNIDTMASGYSDDTQSIWLGVIGRIELQCEEWRHISNIQVFPREKSIDLRITAHSACKSPSDRETVKIRLRAADPNGNALPEKEFEAVLFNRKQILHTSYEIGDGARYWSEFDPALYTLTASMEYGGEITDTKSVSFGMRTVEVRDKRLVLNGRPFALRGTLDCGIYPLTGYPPTDADEWRRVMRTVKEYGLNHVRFHAWCPPEAAFAAADEAGIYVSAEMPLWLNHDVCALETGDDPVHKSYYMREALNISNTFGNHPSFIMFSNGNELMGDFEMLEEITSMLRSYDRRRLYTLTSNFDHPAAPCEDYICAFEACGERVRVQVFHDVISESTRLSYDRAIEKSPVPVISFEIGQYCVYPDVDSVKDYTGNLVPVNFNVIKRDMLEKNVYRRLRRYINASGAFAALHYKEDIEASERTRGMGGFELLGLTDYTGQCTATVGLLDVFWRSKGIISPESFREFCGETVPLMKAGRIFSASDIFEAELDLYNFGEAPIAEPEYTLTLSRKKEILKSVTTKETRISFPLDFIAEPSMIEAALSVNGHTNRWNIFVYPDVYDATQAVILDGAEGLEHYAENGGNVIVNASAENLKNPIQGIFKPVFWSPAYFVSDRACGLWCDSEHPIFDGFPTAQYADFQWKRPIDNSVSADISSLPEDFDVLIEPVPNFFCNLARSPLFEARIGKANVIFNGFDLEADYPAVRALRRSITSYAASERFKPRYELDINTFKNLFK